MTPAHHAVLALCCAVVGFSVGSFLNVCAYRIPRGMSVLWPPSRCPGCLAWIRVYDNIPVLSWLCLRGRCRHCGCAISPRYLFVELATGLSFACAYLVGVALASSDYWERMGVVIGFFLLAVSWVGISILTTAALIAYDARSSAI